MSDTRRAARSPQPPAAVRDDEKLTVRVSAELLSRIDQAALERGMGRSEFVRQALVTHTDEALGPSATSGELTLYDVLAADGAIGRFAGPRELSTLGRHAIRERIRAHGASAAGASGASRQPGTKSLRAG